MRRSASSTDGGSLGRERVVEEFECGVGEAVANELSVAALLRKVMGCEGADVVGDERDVEAEHLGGVADAEFTCLA